MNFAVLRAPDFPLQAVLRGDPHLAEKPVALVDGEGRKARVTHASQAAIEVGLAVTLAMARCPGLIIRARDPSAEAEMQRLISATAFTLSPRVEATDHGCFTIDLQGSEADLAEARMRACVEDLARVGIAVRAGAAATPIVAAYAARCANPVLVIRDGDGFLRSLPLAFAEPSDAQAAILRGWGVATLGDLTALSKSDVGNRLGTEGVRLWERAAGETMRVLRLVEPSRTFAAEWIYEPPVESLEPLLFRLRRFSEIVALELRAAGSVADSLRLTLVLDDETEHQRDFRLPEPSRDVDIWLRVFHSHLETVRTNAPVTAVGLVASPARPPEKQDGLFDTGLRDRAAFWENLAKVAAVLGEDRVGTPQLLDTWRPDATKMMRPAESVPSPEPEPIHPPRGLTLRRFRPPWPARVTFADDRPACVESTAVRDDVRIARGPFQSSGAWWKPGDAWAVQVWEVEVLSGCTYRLAHTEAGWTVEGVLD